MTWLDDYSLEASRTDRFENSPQHLRLLAVGLAGEIGSILAELKKAERERNSYPEYRNRIEEEIGDALWYLTRLSALAGDHATAEVSKALIHRPDSDDVLGAGLRLDVAGGELSRAIDAAEDLVAPLRAVAAELSSVAVATTVPLQHAAASNVAKITSRWPLERVSRSLFDDDSPEEDQLPRKLEVEFRELTRGDKSITLLRCNGLNFGDRVTDNIEESDFYRYHDIFHFAHAVFLGWSPVVRSLLRAKRKSNPAVDEEQDGARAVILEEAVTAIVFSRAKKLAFFDGLKQVDYDLLKTVHGFLQGYEGGELALWQWEEAILNGYRVFRLLREHRGGVVTLNLPKRALDYIAPRNIGVVRKRA